ncbi:hypothetical protein GQ53DRAFT_834299 [Thozetella sp. PMI_491]|nr:hypothetical protein GQ53DRAFT_834299 [Thozetella sp. PMI_491]
MTKAETAAFADEEEPLTSTASSSRTFWFQEEGGAPLHHRNGGWVRRSCYAVFTSPHLYYLTAIFFLLGLYASPITSQWRFGSRPAPVPAPHVRPLCGKSVKEAVALGCTFDFYSDVWLPAMCYDRTVVEQSESNLTELYPLAGGLSPFPIYWDKEMTKLATVEDVMETAFINDKHGYKPDLNIEFHIDYGYHRAHCLHMWRLGVNAADRLTKGERNVAIYWKVASRAHAWHCSKIIIEGDYRDPSSYDTMTPGIGRCVGMDDFWNDAYASVGR